MSTEFAIAEVFPGKLNALVKNIMRQTGETDPNEAVRLVNSGEWVVSKLIRSWREEDGVIRFSVTSDGTPGVGWITRLEGKGFRLEYYYAKRVLCSSSFKQTSGVTTEVAVLPGSFFKDNDRHTAKIRDEAKKRKLVTPNAELACLIREKFGDDEIEAMGLWYIVAMHEPINDSDGNPLLLYTSRGGGGRQFAAFLDRPVFRSWSCAIGFAFAVSPQ